VRHVGDLGNVSTDSSGVAKISFKGKDRLLCVRVVAVAEKRPNWHVDEKISLIGPLSIVG
jgi:hypothetical protein